MTRVSESSNSPLASWTCSLPESPAAVRSDSRCITAMFCTPYSRGTITPSPPPPGPCAHGDPPPPVVAPPRPLQPRRRARHQDRPCLVLDLPEVEHHQPPRQAQPRRGRPGEHV